MNVKITRWISYIILLLATSLFLFTGCGEDAKGTYSVTVVTEGGKVLDQIEVRIYTDDSKENQVAMGITDETGKMSFESEGSIGGLIKLQNVPAGYLVEDTYEIKEKDTKIVLKAELLSTEDLAEVTFKLGDVFADMSVEASDGKQYRISELLKEKKAVVLNFWYLNCNPCKMEFPYLQEAYEEYKNDIEVIALNPVDGTNASVSEFKQDIGLTFPMAVCDSVWEQAMRINAYPTTVVIDRYGTVAFIHRGYVTETETFNKIFGFFVAEDYKQATIRNLEDFDK